jgi:hypothetical protein
VNALAELYQVPLAQFVAERKRLAKESGDKTLLKRRRPTISAWVVNQLWWHARDAFDRMMETAEKLRKGDAASDKPHRDAIAKLRARASTMLGDAGHAPTEGVLRRVTTTLSAIAAAGGWEPSEPGTLADDLDPPGFGAVGLSLPTPPPAPKPHHPKPHAKPKHEPPPKPEKPKIDHAAIRKQKQRAALEASLAKAREHVKQLERELRDLD